MSTTIGSINGIHISTYYDVRLKERSVQITFRNGGYARLSRREAESLIKLLEVGIEDCYSGRGET